MFNILNIFSRKPWKEYDIIFSFIARNIEASGKMSDPLCDLPDAPIRKADQVSFMTGAQDGIGAFHMEKGKGQAELVQNILHLLTDLSLRPNNSNRVKLYNLLKDTEVLPIIDDVLSQLPESNIAIGQLYSELRWFLINSSHRNVIKFSIAVLGMINADDDDLLEILGKHEEFTLFVAVAFLRKHGKENGNKKLFALAKCVIGWGKIHVVQRLEPADEEIKKWLLTEGCENAIMDEYLAYTCAVKGDLVNALNSPEIENGVFQAAGTIIKALINGGPAENIEDYDHGPIVILKYVMHSRLGKRLDDIVNLAVIKDYLKDRLELQENILQQKGWNKSEIIESIKNIEEILDKPEWRPQILDQINGDNTGRYRAVAAARAISFDVWQPLFQLLSTGPTDSWLIYELLRTDDFERVGEVFRMAEEKINFNNLMGEPQNILFLKDQPESDCLDHILQAVIKHQGKGKYFFRIGLQSKLTRNRNFALRVLETWDKDAWPEDSIDLMSALKNKEPNKDILARIETLLSASVF